MISPSNDPEAWAKQYRINREPLECSLCKGKFVPSIPIALRGYRGLATEAHECGPLHQPFIVVAVSEDTKAILQSVKMGNLK